MHPLVRPLLEREQLLGVQVPLVVGRRVAREDRLRVVLRPRRPAPGPREPPCPEHTSPRGRPLRGRGAGAPGRERAARRRACGRARSTSSSARSTSSARARRSGWRSSEDRLPSMILFGPPGVGKTTLARIVAETHGRRVRGALGGLGPRRRRSSGHRAGARPARRERAADDPLHRRDPPLQQGAAGLRAARGRGRPRDADRRDHGEPLLRGELGAALALHGDRARGARRRRSSRRSSARRRGRARAPSCPATIARARRRTSRRRRAQPRSRSSSSRTTTARAEGEPIAERHVLDAARKRPLLYDRKGDQHYDFASAFIKSMRGGDADASVYYLAAMLEAGEDPRFIARRMVILASEDVGNADPRALERRGRGGARARARRAAGGAAQPRPGGDLPRPRAEVERVRDGDLGGAPRRARARERAAAGDAPLDGPPKRREGPRPRRGLRLPARRPAGFELEYLPEQLRGRRYYRPGDPLEGLDLEAVAEYLHTRGEPDAAAKVEELARSRRAPTEPQ